MVKMEEYKHKFKGDASDFGDNGTGLGLERGAFSSRRRRYDVSRHATTGGGDHHRVVESSRWATVCNQSIDQSFNQSIN